MSGIWGNLIIRKKHLHEKQAYDEVTLWKKSTWKQFMKTGRIVDYLYYRGMKICYRVMERSQKKTYESDYRDGHGAFGNSGGRL